MWIHDEYTRFPITGMMFHERELFSPAESKKRVSDIIFSLLEATTTYTCMEWLEKRKRKEKKRRERGEERKKGGIEEGGKGELENQ